MGTVVAGMTLALDGGLRLFAPFDGPPLELERIQVIAYP